MIMMTNYGIRLDSIRKQDISEISIAYEDDFTRVWTTTKDNQPWITFKDMDFVTMKCNDIETAIIESMKLSRCKQFGLTEMPDNFIW